MRPTLNFIRKIVNSDVLENIVKLPDDLKHQQVEILILPVSKKIKKISRRFKPQDFIGSLKIKDVDKKIKAMRDEWERI